MIIYWILTIHICGWGQKARSNSYQNRCSLCDFWMLWSPPKTYVYSYWMSCFMAMFWSFHSGDSSMSAWGVWDAVHVAEEILLHTLHMLLGKNSYTNGCSDQGSLDPININNPGRSINCLPYDTSLQVGYIILYYIILYYIILYPINIEKPGSGCSP